jgi:cytoskeletal protein CcmA (bactofilin family)
MAETNSEYGTILGPDAKFKGDLSFDSAAKVLGTIEGSIKSKGRVLIADGANCRASVTAKEIAIEGLIEGNVEATERVEIKANGRITGDVVAARMTMGDGAAIEGHVRIGIDLKPNSMPKATGSTEPKVAMPQPAKVK